MSQATSNNALSAPASPGRLASKVALIIGAARGQGRSHALTLAREGADIIAVDICADIPGIPTAGPTPADLATTAEQVREHGRRVITAEVDVRNLDVLDKVIAEAVDSLGRLDIVAANAGIGAWPDKLVDLAPTTWQDMLDINLTGVWNTVKAAGRHLIDAGRGGSIVLTSSAAGLKGYPNIGHYVTAKHALVGLMRTLALELAPHFIRVNSLHPTQVNTDMIMNPGVFKLFCPDIDEPTLDDFRRASQATQALPIPWVEPADVSNALLFLVSDDARYITGVPLPVDGGCLLR